MNNEEYEIISKVLVSEEKQIAIDTIQILEKYNVEDKEKFYQLIKKQLEEKRRRIISYRR